jgi:hypothetical protein
MRGASRLAAVVGLGLSLGLSMGCHRRGMSKEGAQIQNQAMKTTGATQVMAAIDKKDYNAAVATLMQLKLAATNRQQLVQYMVIQHQAQMKMLAATNDPAAMNALQGLQMMELGR